MSRLAMEGGPANALDPPKRGTGMTLAVLLLGQFMGLLDSFVVNVAMPAIGTDLKASGASLQMV
ncbi:MAG TPA: hypothetical protein VFB40_25085, partial [Actinocrinis sp.]|nr:hypothetical protein [Actinocrinis sp.]